MFSFDFTFDGGLESAKQAARELSVDLRSLKEPLKRAVKEVMIPSFRQNFDSEGRPSWTPAARNYGHSLLNDTGRLRNATGLLAIWDFDREHAKLNPTSLASRVGAKIVHQTGVTRRSGGLGKTSSGIHTIPARPFIMMQFEDEEKIQRIFEEYLRERVERRWGR